MLSIMLKYNIMRRDGVVTENGILTVLINTKIVLGSKFYIQYLDNTNDYNIK